MTSVKNTFLHAQIWNTDTHATHINHIPALLEDEGIRKWVRNTRAQGFRCSLDSPTVLLKLPSAIARQRAVFADIRKIEKRRSVSIHGRFDGSLQIPGAQVLVTVTGASVKDATLAGHDLLGLGHFMQCHLPADGTEDFASQRRKLVRALEIACGVRITTSNDVVRIVGDPVFANIAMKKLITRFSLGSATVHKKSRLAAETLPIRYFVSLRDAFHGTSASMCPKTGASASNASNTTPPFKLYHGRTCPPSLFTACENPGEGDCGWHALSQQLDMSTAALRKLVTSRGLQSTFCGIGDCLRWICLLGG